jgi:hypothetical protein
MMDEPDKDTADDDFNKLFGGSSSSSNSKDNKSSNSSNGDNKSTQHVARVNSADKIFINGTERGRQTQNMFNMFNKIITKTERGMKAAGSKTMSHVASSDLYRLNN